MTNLINIVSGSVTSLLLASSVHALDVSVGADVAGIGVDAGVSVGHGSVAAADVGATFGGDNTSGSGATADVGASIGGSSSGSGATANAGASGGSSGGGTGSGSGTGVTGSVNTAAAVGASAGTMSETAAFSSQARLKPQTSIDDFLGATIMTSDREVVGMIEKVRGGADGKIIATVRMNAAFGANGRTIQLRLQAPEKDPDLIRLGFTKTSLLARINS